MTVSLKKLKESPELIDSFIRDEVIKINERGIKTLWCCSGLFEDHKELLKEKEVDIESRSISMSSEMIWHTAYLCLEVHDSLRPVHGWDLNEIELSTGAAMTYSVDIFNFVESDVSINDEKLKELWVRLFNSINQFSR